MKKIKREKLNLSIETIRQLDDPKLRDVAGGLPSVSCLGTCWTCPSVAAQCNTIGFPCGGSLRNSQCYSCP